MKLSFTVTSVILSLLVLTACTTVYHKMAIIDEADIGDPAGTIKLYGYYYTTLQVQTYEEYINELGNRDQDWDKPILEERIKPIILYADGGVSQMYEYTGVSKPFYRLDSIKECKLNPENTIEEALKRFECDIMNTDPLGNRATSISGGGVFQVRGNQITIQTYYQRGYNYSLYEKYGEIIDSETFQLTKEYDYNNREYKEINELYHFKSMPERPKFSNFIFEKFY